ncbi:hypothetical protein [Polaromonas sp. CG9_12]|nr:hypothetical protein [Polaromonas sp. CG9_12]
MSGAAFLRIKKLKGGGIITVAARHNRRVIQAEMGATGSIDPARSHLNETLHGPQTADDVGQLAKDLMREAGVVKFRKDSVMALEFVFSLPSDHRIDDRAYFADCAAWAAAQYGGAQNILSVDIHRDEGAPHCHVLLLPLLNRKLAGSDMVGGKQKLMATHKQFHDSVASGYGLLKAPARLTGASKQAAAAAVLAKLKSTSDPALSSMAWATIRDGIETNPGPWVLALGIEIDVAKKSKRSFTQIMTSKGKGPAKEPNPIGFGTASKEQTLCSVGFGPKQPPPATPKTAPPPAPPPPARPPGPAHDDVVQVDQHDTTATGAPPPARPAPAFTDSVRVRDNQIDASLYDPNTGEYFQRPPPPARHNRAAADGWVTQTLASRNTDSTMPSGSKRAVSRPDKFNEKTLSSLNHLTAMRA